MEEKKTKSSRARLRSSGQPPGRKKQPKLTEAQTELFKREGLLDLYKEKTLTFHQIVFLINFRRNPFNISKICRTIGISFASFSSYKKDNPVFRQILEEIELSIIDLVEEALLENAINGDFNSQKLFLQSKAKDRGYGQQMDVSVKKADLVEFIDVNVDNEDLDDSFILDSFKEDPDEKNNS